MTKVSKERKETDPMLKGSWQAIMQVTKVSMERKKTK